MTCSTSGCERPRRYRSTGECHTCYMARRRRDDDYRNRVNARNRERRRHAEPRTLARIAERRAFLTAFKQTVGCKDCGATTGRLEFDPSKKSIKLPAGTLKSRAGQNKWTVDADAFLEWFDASEDVQAALPELVRVKREPSVSAIKAAFEPKDDRAIDPATGEIVAGVTVEPGQRTFSVEVAE